MANLKKPVSRLILLFILMVVVSGGILTFLSINNISNLRMLTEKRIQETQLQIAGQISAQFQKKLNSLADEFDKTVLSGSAGFDSIVRSEPPIRPFLVSNEKEFLYPFFIESGQHYTIPVSNISADFMNGEADEFQKENPENAISRDFEKGKSLKLSYTKRLARPGIWYLNPYYDDTDPRNISIGNPQLETEVADNFDFSFNRFSEKFNFSLNLNASFSGNLIADVSTVQPDGVKITTYKNIGNDHMFGGTVYGSLQLTKKFNVNATIGLNYRDIESNNDVGLSNSGWGNSGKFDMKFNPWKNGTLLAGAGTNSGSIYLQGTWPRWIWSYVTYQHDFLDNKLKLETRLDGPFTKYIGYPYKRYNQYFHETNTSRFAARVLSFKLSYNFGQMKDQVKKAKRSIMNDDVKRGG